MAMTDVLQAQAFAGLTKGATSAYNDLYTEEGKARRVQLKEMKATSEENMRVLEATKPTEDELAAKKQLQNDQVETLTMQLEQQQSEIARTRIFSAFDRYEGDNDLRHLNNVLADSNKQGRKMFGQRVRIDPITDTDVKLLQKHGIDPQLVLQNPELRNDIIKTTNADGSISLDMISSLYKMSGYTRFAQDRTLNRLAKEATIMSAFTRTGARTADERLAHQLAEVQGLKPDSPEYDEFVANKLVEMREKKGTSRLSTKEEREVDRILAEEGLEPGTDAYIQRYNEVYNNIVQRNRQTAVSKNIDEAESATAKLDALATAEGAESFFDPELITKPSVRAKAWPHVRRIEQLGGAELTADDKKPLHYIRGLLAIADKPGELTEGQTGLIDRLFNNVKKYVSNDVEGIDRTSAWATFRNLAQNALYGATLPEGEAKLFREQFGTLGQQLGPVLQQFSTELVQVQAKLQAVYDLNDPYVMQYYVGADQMKLASIIDALQERIDLMDSMAQSPNAPVSNPNAPTRQPVQPKPAPVLTPEQIQELDALSRGGI